MNKNVYYNKLKKIIIRIMKINKSNLINNYQKKQKKLIIQKNNYSYKNKNLNKMKNNYNKITKKYSMN